MKIRDLTLTITGMTLACGLIMQAPFSRAALAENAPDPARGQKVFSYWCAPCHAAGPAHPGTQSLEIKYRDSNLPAVLEERRDLTPEFVRTIVRSGILSMPPFRKTEISDAELDDIAAYLSK
jgi:mono/diheme cytochrome c family protein